MAGAVVQQVWTNSQMYSCLHSNIAPLGCLYYSTLSGKNMLLLAPGSKLVLFRPCSAFSYLGFHLELVNIYHDGNCSRFFSHQHSVVSKYRFLCETYWMLMMTYWNICCDSYRSPAWTYWNAWLWRCSQTHQHAGPTLHRTGWNLAPEHRWPLWFNIALSVCRRKSTYESEGWQRIPSQSLT